ncbi:hypothetical protein SK128_016145 [Halocaridina rubra]|uniref:Uncharacterized protein n=1 Tax=Halocaridina rubra TaxID=373956 RepID=A0AAN9A389_HALRR
MEKENILRKIRFYIDSQIFNDVQAMLPKLLVGAMRRTRLPSPYSQIDLVCNTAPVTLGESLFIWA